MDPKQTPMPMPKKSCMITIMFPVDDDTEALALKQIVDKAVEPMKEKRYTFQINEV